MSLGPWLGVVAESLIVLLAFLVAVLLRFGNVEGFLGYDFLVAKALLAAKGSPWWTQLSGARSLRTVPAKDSIGSTRKPEDSTSKSRHFSKRTR